MVKNGIRNPRGVKANTGMNWQDGGGEASSASEMHFDMIIYREASICPIFETFFNGIHGWIMS
jgi:hypothetical protein